MILAVRTRRQQIRRIRQVVGLLVVLGLNLALGSCASALASDADYGCPHCPQSSQLLHGDVAPHHEMASNDMPCASGAADCGALEVINQDSRSSHLKLKDTSDDAPVAIVATGVSISAYHAVEPVGALPTPSTLPGAPAPLNVLYCVYLD